jgi:hypothetical protein
MSYFSDHLAWQQRVAKEFNTTTMPQDSSKVYSYPDLVT